MKAHLQLRPCCREAQCGTGKAAYRIATSFQSAGYNTNVACLAPALVPRAMLKAYSVSPGMHFLHCGITHPWPSRLQMRNSLPLFPILAMFPLFPLLYQNWTVLKRQHASSHTSRGWAANVTMEKNRVILRRVWKKCCTDDGLWEKYQTGQSPWTWLCRQTLREPD